MKPIFDQYGENIRANIGLSLVIPILNGRTASINVERARIGILSQQLLNYQDAQKLKQDIYTAHQQALCCATTIHCHTTNAKRSPPVVGFCR
jgi:outer membrane protein